MHSSNINLKGDNPFPQPLVSIIIPTFNRPDSLRETLESVLAQTCRNFEAIVINDGGADVSGVIAVVNNDKRIVYLQHSENKGLAAARNTAIRAAHGKYVAYLDDDDIYYPEHLETLVGFLESSNYKVAYTDSYQADQTWMSDRYITTRKEIIYSCDFSREKLLIRNYIPILNLVYRIDLLDDVGLFDETLGTHEDWELLIRLSQRYDFAHVKAVTAEFRMRDDATNMTEYRRSNYIRTLRQIYQLYSHLALDTGIREAQKNIEESLEIDVAIRQLPSRELFRKVAQHIQRKNERIEDLDAVIRSKDAHIGDLESLIRDKDVKIGDLHNRSKNLEADNTQLVTENNRMEEERARSLRDIYELKRATGEKNNRVLALENSLSWRITAPLRWFSSFLLHPTFHEAASVALPVKTNDLNRMMASAENKIKSKSLMQQALQILFSEGPFVLSRRAVHKLCIDLAKNKYCESTRAFGLDSPSESSQLSRISQSRISKVTGNRSHYVVIKNGTDFNREAIREVLHGIARELKKEMYLDE
jgi:glycosyltransferase involved in cell wall biosynthesis